MKNFFNILMEVEPVTNSYLNGKNVIEQVLVNHSLPTFDHAFRQLYLDMHQLYHKESARTIGKPYSITSAIVTDPCGNTVISLDGMVLKVNFDFASKDLLSIFKNPVSETTVPISTRNTPRDPKSAFRLVEEMHLSSLKRNKGVDYYSEKVTPVDAIDATPRATRQINYERFDSFKDAFTKILADVFAVDGTILNREARANFPIIEIIKPDHVQHLARIMPLAYNSITQALESGIYFKILDDSFIRKVLKYDTDLRNVINLYGPHTPLAESTTTSWRHAMATAQTMKYHRKNIQGEIPIKNLQTTRFIHELSSTKQIRV